MGYDLKTIYASMLLYGCSGQKDGIRVRVVLPVLVCICFGVPAQAPEEFPPLALHLLP